MTKAGLAWQVKSKGWRASDRDVSQRSTLCVRVGDFGGGNALQTRLKSVPVADICRIERRVKIATYVLLVSKNLNPVPIFARFGERPGTWVTHAGVLICQIRFDAPARLIGSLA